MATAKSKLFRYKQVQCRASVCPVLVSGSAEQIRFAWEVGVGHSRGSGWGALVKKKPPGGAAFKTHSEGFGYFFAASTMRHIASIKNIKTNVRRTNHEIVIR